VSLYPADTEAATIALGGNAPIDMDALSIYNRALSADEVAAKHEAKANGYAVAFDGSEISVGVDATATLSAHVVRFPNIVVPMYDDMVTYAIDGNAATISGAVVTGKTEGTATVTASVSGVGADTLKVTVIPGVEATGVTVSGTASTPVGVPVQLTATLTPVDATNQVTWSVDDATVATVSSDGLVTPLKVGTAVVTATAGEVSGNYTVTVTDPLLIRYEFDGDLTDSSSYHKSDAVRGGRATVTYVEGHSGEDGDQAVKLGEGSGNVAYGLQMPNNILPNNTTNYTFSAWVNPCFFKYATSLPRPGA